MTDPACMTPDELRLWNEAADVAARHSSRKRRVSSPCVDCPVAWAEAMRVVGHCNGEPGGNEPGRPRAVTPPSHEPAYRRRYFGDYRARNLERIRERDRVRKRLAYALLTAARAG